MAHGPFGHVLVAVAIENRAVLTVTGTVAQTTAASTSVASGSTVTGSTAVTTAASTMVASGTFTSSSVTGTVAVTTAASTSVASGSTVTGTVAVTTANATSVASGTSYIFVDEFTGSVVDTTKWSVYNRLGDQANSEENAVIPANARVSGGSFFIDAKFEDVTIGDTLTAPKLVHYTSAQIAQKGLFRYGTVECRAKIPGGTGVWPCIWMLGYGWQPLQAGSADDLGTYPVSALAEIDIAEFMNNARTTVNNQIHNVSNPGGLVSLPYNATSRFMVYRLQWTVGQAVFSVDPEDGGGYQTLTTINTVVPDIPMYFILNMAVGGIGGGTPDSATFPLTMEVDYVRISPNSDTQIAVEGTLAQTTAASTSVAAGSSVIGTVAKTTAASTMVASGTFTSGSVTGTVAVTTANATSVAAGSSVTGACTRTTDASTMVASGASGAVSGTVAQTTANSTCTAAGSSVTGTCTRTTSDSTSVASGSFTVSGTLGRTTADATLVAVGGHGPSGTCTRTTANATMVASGGPVVDTNLNPPSSSYTVRIRATHTARVRATHTVRR